MRLVRCPACRTEWPAPQSICGACFFEPLLPVPASRDAVPYGQPGARPHRSRRKNTRDLGEVLRTHQRPRLRRWGYPALQLPLDASVLLSGRPGSGKSTSGVAMTLGLALEGVRTLWVSPEEGCGDTTVRRFELVHGWYGRPSLPTGTPLVSDARTLSEVHVEIAGFEAGGPGVVFVDSLTTLGASAQWWEDLTNGPLGVVGIAHQNNRGTPFGGHRVAHDPDVHLSVSDFQVSVEKSRWFADDQPRAWRVDDLGTAGPDDLREGEVVRFPPRGPK